MVEASSLNPDLPMSIDADHNPFPAKQAGKDAPALSTDWPPRKGTTVIIFFPSHRPLEPFSSQPRNADPVEPSFLAGLSPKRSGSPWPVNGWVEIVAIPTRRDGFS